VFDSCLHAYVWLYKFPNQYGQVQWTKCMKERRRLLLLETRITILVSFNLWCPIIDMAALLQKNGCLCCAIYRSASLTSFYQICLPRSRITLISCVPKYIGDPLINMVDSLPRGMATVVDESVEVCEIRTRWWHKHWDNDLDKFRPSTRCNTLCPMSLVDCIIRDEVKTRGSLPALYSSRVGLQVSWI
jgi:hypothetical protein